MNTITLLTNIVLSITGFQLILLAVVFLNQETKNRLSRNVLVTFLLAKTFLIIRWILFGWKILPYQDLVYLYHISKSVFFLLAPLLYFYIRSFCFKDFVFRKAHLSHAALFFLFVFFTVASAYILVAHSVSEASLVYKIFILHHDKIFWALNFIQILFYILAMLHTVSVYRRELTNSQSSIDKVNLNWLYALLALIFMHWIFVVFRATLGLLFPDALRLTSLIDLYSISIFLVFTTVLVLQGLSQLKIFPGIENSEKYINSLLPKPEIKAYTEQLRQFMRTQKPYLVPSLTIEELSERMAIPSWKLSQVINYSFNQNFFNFINSYRIQEVKQKFEDPKNHRKTILEILYETGFNSKSTFNDVFKKYTGKTPTEFRRRNHVQALN